MCGNPLGKTHTMTGALIFGNKTRDPHVGPYCKDCVPPAIAEIGDCVKDCPLTDVEWISLFGNCIVRARTYRGYKSKCEFSLGRSPIRHGISCIHPDRLEEKKRKKKERVKQMAEKRELRNAEGWAQNQHDHLG